MGVILTSRQARRGFARRPEMEPFCCHYIGRHQIRRSKARAASPPNLRKHKLKKLLLATTAAIIPFSAPAFAWQGEFRFVNQATTWPPVFTADSIIFSAVDGPHTIALNDIGPGQAQRFLFLKYDAVWVTVTSEYVAPVTTTTPCDLRTKNTFKLTQPVTTGKYVLTCSSNPALQ
jgi:hypothetical protein